MASAALLRRTGLVVAGLVLGNVAAWAAGSQMTPPLEHHSWIAQRKAEQIEGLRTSCTDLVVLGSSVSLMGVDPSVLIDRLPAVDSAYNAGLGGSYVGIEAEWYRRFVAPALKPATVVHVLGLPSISTDRAGARDITASWEGARGSATGFLATADRMLSEVVPAMRYRERLVDPAEWYGLVGGEVPEDRRPDPQVDLMDDRGFIGRPETGDPAEVPVHAETIRRVLRDDGEPIQEEQLQLLVSLVEEQRASGTTVLLVLAPVDVAYRAALVEDVREFDRYRAAMRAVAERASVPLLDLSDLEIPITSFWDGIHLNLDGARQFTDAIADELIALDLAGGCP